jgi:16S rRNA processing protein RimM
VSKTQGRHGEVLIELHTDFPESFADRRRIFALNGQGVRQELNLDSFWPHKGSIVLKFAGVDSISQAENLVGCELQVPLAKRSALDPGVSYVSDLVGCVVWAGESRIGIVIDVRFGAGEAPLLVLKGGKEYEIPYAEAYLTRVDLPGKEIHMQLPEGMLDINAPLTEEEKRQQRK